MNQKFMVRSEDLVAVNAPGPGDCFVMARDGQRWDILSGALDHLGEYWLFCVQRSAHEDWGALAGAVTASDDRGDLAAATVAEDYGTLT